MTYEPLIPLPTLLLTLDLAGTCVFAISGAAAGVKSRLDIFGVLVLAIVAGSAGGVIRDLLIGAIPPAAVGDWRYLGASVLARFALDREAEALVMGGYGHSPFREAITGGPTRTLLKEAELPLVLAH